MSDHLLDLRSDTVTRPSAGMWEAMRSAALGDDVLGDDPTVDALEKKVAEITGHEAAVYVPSGTMSNQIALTCHTERGDCVLFDAEAHMLFYEVGAPGVIAQVVTRTIGSVDGVMDPREMERSLQVGSLHTPPTTLICIENTHNRAGGAVIPMAMLDEYERIARSHGLNFHLDGARVWNAATDLGIPVREITARFDSVSVCLSKGLGAPVGSVLCGGAAFIQKARRWRKRLGGGMRQSGMLAAAGIYALDHHYAELKNDHILAAQIAQNLVGKPGIHVDLNRQFTNFVMVDTDAPAADWVQKLDSRGVMALPFGPHRVRLVTHRDLPAACAERVAAAFS